MLDKQSTTDYSSPNFTLVIIYEVLKSENNYCYGNPNSCTTCGQPKPSVLVSALILDAEAKEWPHSQNTLTEEKSKKALQRLG